MYVGGNQLLSTIRLVMERAESEMESRLQGVCLWMRKVISVDRHMRNWSTQRLGKTRENLNLIMGLDRYRAKESLEGSREVKWMCRRSGQL